MNGTTIGGTVHRAGQGGLSFGRERRRTSDEDQENADTEGGLLAENVRRGGSRAQSGGQLGHGEERTPVSTSYTEQRRLPWLYGWQLCCHSPTLADRRQQRWSRTRQCSWI